MNFAKTKRGGTYEREEVKLLDSSTNAFLNSIENGSKLFPFMNSYAFHDSADPGFFHTPSDTGVIKSFLFHKWFDCCDTAE